MFEQNHLATQRQQLNCGVNECSLPRKRGHQDALLTNSGRRETEAVSCSSDGSEKRPTDGRCTDPTQRGLPGTERTWERRSQRKRRMMRLCRDSTLLHHLSTMISAHQAEERTHLCHREWRARETATPSREQSNAKHADDDAALVINAANVPEALVENYGPASRAISRQDSTIALSLTQHPVPVTELGKQRQIPTSLPLESDTHALAPTLSPAASDVSQPAETPVERSALKYVTPESPMDSGPSPPEIRNLTANAHDGSCLEPRSASSSGNDRDLVVPPEAVPQHMVGAPAATTSPGPAGLKPADATRAVLGEPPKRSYAGYGATADPTPPTRPVRDSPVSGDVPRTRLTDDVFRLTNVTDPTAMGELDKCFPTARKAAHEGGLSKKLDPGDRAAIESAVCNASDRRDKNCSVGEGHFPEGGMPPNALNPTMTENVKPDEAFSGHSIDDQSEHDAMKRKDLLPSVRGRDVHTTASDASSHIAPEQRSLMSSISHNRPIVQNDLKMSEFITYLRGLKREFVVHDFSRLVVFDGVLVATTTTTLRLNPRVRLPGLRTDRDLLLIAFQVWLRVWSRDPRFKC